MQSRKNSFIESLSQVVVGYIVAITGQLLIYPYFDINISLVSNLIIGLCFAIIAVTKSYAIRRLFNEKTEVNELHVDSKNNGLSRQTAIDYMTYNKSIYNEENLPMMLRRQAD